MKTILNLLFIIIIISSFSGCAYVNHDLDEYDGEVFLTSPPENIPEERLVPFRITDSHIRILEMLPLYSYKLDKCLLALNPERYPIYNLECSETFEAWELIILAVQLVAGAPDSRTVCVEGVILVPEDNPDWKYKPALPLFGPTLHKVP
jgi:hypothetical protein